MIKLQSIRSCFGLTLIELMITLGVIAILAAIAWPLFDEQSRSNRRTDAIIAIKKLAHALEQYKSDTGNYNTISTTDFDNYEPGVIPNISNPRICIRRGFVGSGPTTFTSCNSYYNLAISNLSASTYTITATVASPDLVADEKDCRSFTLDHLGVKGATGTSFSGSATIGSVTRAKRCWGSN